MPHDVNPKPDAFPERLTLHLRILPDDIPAAIRVRKLLKALLRSLRLRCEAISLPPEPTEGQGQAGESKAR